jgi:hypothetical protein
MRRAASACVASVLFAAPLASVFVASCGSSEATTADNGDATGATTAKGGAGGKGGAAGSSGKSGASGASSVAGGSAGAAGAGAAGAGGGGASGASAQGGAAGQSGFAGGAGKSGAAGAAGQAGSAGNTGSAGAGGGPVVCKPSETDCSGVCADLKSDPKSCGQCGKACDAGAACCDGTCVEAASCSFAVTGLSSATGFLNGGAFLTLTGTGFAEGMRVYLGTGRAPTRVVDATHAIIQIPPGPLGPQDVKIVASAAAGAPTATLKGGFIYQSAGLSTKWEQKPLATVRGEDPGLAVMQDGRVLVAGGTVIPDAWDMALDTAEIYTRSTDTVTQAKNKMSTARWQNSAITLLTGKVLVVGGACLGDLSKCAGDATAADLFDPTTDAFTKTAGSLSAPRAYTRAVLLVDGRVLISSASSPALDIYDPKTDTFTALPHTSSHVYGMMVRLRDGRVLLAAGDGGNTAAELFDPDTSTLKDTGKLTQGRSMLTAHTLPDGRVIAIGGASLSAGGVTDPLSSVELFDPATESWSTAPYALSTGRCWHASALVRDGSILVMGGYTQSGMCSSLTASVDQIDPIGAASKIFPDILNKNTEWTAVTLLDGSILGVGGGACGASQALPDIDFLAGKD